MSVQDPFYLVKEEVQSSVDTLQARFQQLERIAPGSNLVRALSEIGGSCESLEWQLGELAKAIAVAERDPMRFNISSEEIVKRNRWLNSTRNQVGSIRRGVERVQTQVRQQGPVASATGVGGGAGIPSRGGGSDGAYGRGGVDGYGRGKDGTAGQGFGRGNGDAGGGGGDGEDLFTTDEVSRQQLLMRQQDDELDELSAGVQRIGQVGFTIHQELVAQEGLLEEFEGDLDSTSNRLQLAQRKIEAILKKGGMKMQLCVMTFLVILLIILLFTLFS